MNTGADPIERLIQQAQVIGANAQHGAQRLADRLRRIRSAAVRNRRAS